MSGEDEWSIVTADGERMTGYLPAWAQDNPSKASVPPDRLAIELADITHEASFGGELLRVCSGGQDPGENSTVLSAVMQCRPFTADRQPMPLVSVQLLDDFWIKDLDPVQLMDVAVMFRCFADLLATKVVPALYEAQTDWAACSPLRLRKV